MAYKSYVNGIHRCPSSHPVALVEISEKIFYPAAPDIGTWSISSDMGAASRFDPARRLVRRLGPDRDDAVAQQLCHRDAQRQQRRPVRRPRPDERQELHRPGRIGGYSTDADVAGLIGRERDDRL